MRFYHSVCARQTKQMASSVKKKMKDKSFAANVNREDIIKGSEELGVPLEEHIQFVIEAMKGISREIGF